MVRIQDFGGSAALKKSKKPAGEKRKRSDPEVGEASALPAESGPSAVVLVPLSTGGDSSAPAPLPIVPAGADLASGEQEDVEEVAPLARKRRLVKLADLPSGPAAQETGGASTGPLSLKASGKKKKNSGKRSKSKVVDKWESTIVTEKGASVGDVHVSLHIAEKATTPADEELMEKLGDVELASRVVRSCTRSMTMAFDSYRRIDRLATINQEQGQEILKLTERAKKAEDELLVVKEERDVLQAKHSSLEEENKSIEEERKLLKIQLSTGEEERLQLGAEKDRLVEEMKVVKERSTKFLLDCQAAVEGQLRTEDMLRELRVSVRQQRVEAIKRWKRRNLNAECLELASDMTLSVLKKCYEVQFPVGSDGPSFEEFAEPLLPALGLSLAEMREIVERERRDVPDEELDCSSEDEEEEEEEPVADPSSSK